MASFICINTSLDLILKVPATRSRLCLNNETTRKHPEMTGQRQDYKNAAAVLIRMDLTAYI